MQQQYNKETQNGPEPVKDNNLEIERLKAFSPTEIFAIHEQHVRQYLLTLPLFLSLNLNSPLLSSLSLAIEGFSHSFLRQQSNKSQNDVLLSGMIRSPFQCLTHVCLLTQINPPYLVYKEVEVLTWVPPHI